LPITGVKVKDYLLVPQQIILNLIESSGRGNVNLGRFSITTNAVVLQEHLPSCADDLIGCRWLGHRATTTPQA
jgi:hypothetical protein